MSDFTEIAKRYERDSMVQKSASEILFDILEIEDGDDVLDLGCGTGHLSRMIREKTQGKAVGVDPSPGMIDKARERFSGLGINFHLSSAEALNYLAEFDKIFCNSAFQWFAHPEKVLVACHAALKSCGKMAIQAPAKDNYCPQFLRAIAGVSNHEAPVKFLPPSLPPGFCETVLKNMRDCLKRLALSLARPRSIQLSPTIP